MIKENRQHFGLTNRWINSFKQLVLSYYADKQMDNKFLTARPILLCSHAVPVLKKTFLVESFKFNSHQLVT